MKKEYRTWHTQKEKINDKGARVFFHELDVWFAHLGANVGFEQDGTGDEFLRPVLVFQKFNNDIFWALPLTHTIKNNKFYAVFPFNGGMSSAILSQIRLLDGKRLRYKAGVLAEEQFGEIKEKFRRLIA